MSVPFEALGPGQKGRLVYQVMGKDGPIFNPNGIRYLPASEVDAAHAASPLIGTVSQAATALAGVNLLVGVGTLALAAATYSEVKKANAKLDRLLEFQAEIGSNLETIIAKLDRIDLKVSEARLATLVAHACSEAAMGDDELAFEPLGQLGYDLDAFIKDAGIIRGVASNLRLGSDVRSGLNRIVRLLRGVRVQLATEHNRHVGAEGAWRCHPVEDYWDRAEELGAMDAYRQESACFDVFGIAAHAAHVGVDARFSFDSWEDHEAIQRVMDLALASRWEALGLTGTQSASACEAALQRSMGEARHSLAGWGDADAMQRYCDDLKQFAFTTLYAHGRCSCAFPPGIARAAEEDPTMLARYRAWWLHQTDAGLVYRASRECLAVANGYARAWPELAVSVAGLRALPAPPPVVVDVTSVLEHATAPTAA